MIPWPPVLLGFIAGAIGTYITRTVARKLSFVAKPNPIVPQHREPVAYLGGVGLAFGLLCGIIAASHWPGYGIAAGATSMLLLGLIDDLRPFKPTHKLLAQVAIAIMAVALGLNIQISANGWIDFGISCFLLLFWVNAVNLTDVCDGLVGGLSAVAFLGLFALGGFSNPLPILGAAACCGFLVFNKPSATIYLGDAGSHMLGFLLAAITFELMADGDWKIEIGSVLCSLVFIFELLFLFCVRMYKGLPWWRGSPDHFSLRMQAGPFTRWQTVLLAWLAGAITSAAGLLVVHLDTPQVMITLGVLFIGVVTTTVCLLRWNVPGPQGDTR